MLDTILRILLCQIVQVRLQHEAIERVERVFAELGNEIDFNLGHLFLRRFRPPVPDSKRKVAVPNKPLEGRPISPRGIEALKPSFASCPSGSSAGVSIGPGLITLTRMFRSLRSTSQVRAKERTAALLAEYTLKTG